jgi:hypothetical protein
LELSESEFHITGIELELTPLDPQAQDEADFYDLLVEHRTSEIENPGQLAASTSHDWPLTVAQIAYALPPSLLLIGGPPSPSAPGVCEISDY